MINRKICFIVLASMGMTLAARAQDKPNQQTEGKDTQGKSSTFIKETAAGNHKEVTLAELAASKSQNEEIKALAEHIKKDHSEANTKLKSIAEKHGVIINQTGDSKQQRGLARFQNLSGAQFDQEFAKEMLRDHQKTITRFEQTAKEASDSDVQEYAQQTLPKLRQHLQHAKTAAKAVGVDEKTISSLTRGTPEGVGGTGDEEKSETGRGQDKKE
jgi:putative membrane protein